jgi:TRAP-type transport system small permease protein
VRLVRLGIAVLKGFIAFLLFAIVVMVFGNVVLRYGFNSGIDVSEELSRWCLVWITFLGATVALKEGRHLGVDFLIARLTRRGRSWCFAITRTLMLVVALMFTFGSIRQTRIDWDVAAPVTGLSTGWFYGVAVVFGIGAVIIILYDLYRLATGVLTDAELIGVIESEEAR